MRSQGVHFEGTEASLSFVQCFLYLVSSSVNVSIFHITWLYAFWIDLISVDKTHVLHLLIRILKGNATLFIKIKNNITSQTILTAPSKEER